MKKTQKYLGIILSFMLLLMTGCGYEPKLSNGQELVAEIEGNKITVDSLYEEVKNRFARDVLIDMIDTFILDSKYPVDDEMNRTIDSQIEYIKLQTGNDFLQAIKYYYGANSEEEFRQMLITEQQRTNAVRDYVKTLITDKEIEKHYNDEIVGDIKASHILIKPDVTSEMTDEEKEAKENEALNLAKDIIEKLDNGEAFAILAKEYSDDKANSDQGGDLGFFNKGKMDENFEKAAYELKKGAYTKTAVKSQFGYHIILKTDEKAKPELKTVRSNIIDILVSKKLEADAKLNIKALVELRKENKLKIHDTELKKQYDNYIDDMLSSQN
ncbi:MAG: peptidylprolyl isomerase [Bacilli bacterium]|jgi:foldase protein PrsA